MLARHAESLFWAGRYLERAEDTARLLEVTHRSTVSARRSDAAERWADLVAALHVEEYMPELSMDAEAVLDHLVRAPENAASINAAVLRLRENFRSVREVIPSELWEQTNRFYLDLNRGDVRARLRRDAFGLLSMVRERCQSLAGIAIETMMRDEGYRFMILGQALERAMMAARILHVRFPALAERDYEEVSLTLRAVSGFEAFRRNYRSSNDPRDVAEFLLLGAGFPRSVLYCLVRAEDQLIGLDESGRASRPRRRLGQLRASLEYSTIDDVLHDLGAELAHVEGEIGQVCEAIATQFFRGAEEFGRHAQLVLPGETLLRGDSLLRGDAPLRMDTTLRGRVF